MGQRDQKDPWLPHQPRPPVIPTPRGPVPVPPTLPPRRQVSLTVNGRKVSVAEGTTLLEALRGIGIDTPTLCYLETLTPVNVCRICVVERSEERRVGKECRSRWSP